MLNTRLMGIQKCKHKRGVLRFRSTNSYLPWPEGLRTSGCVAILLLIGLLLLGSCGGGETTFPPKRRLISLAIDPTDAEAVAPDGTAPFDAIGTFDQAPTTEANVTVKWTSGDTTVVSIDSNTGVATCVAAGGPVTITASTTESGSKIQATAKLTCQASPPPPSADGHCVYICPSVRCPQLTGYCAGERDAACHQSYQPGACQPGTPAKNPGTLCDRGVDLASSCNSSAGKSVMDLP